MCTVVWVLANETFDLFALFSLNPSRVRTNNLRASKAEGRGRLNGKIRDRGPLTTSRQASKMNHLTPKRKVTCVYKTFFQFRDFPHNNQDPFEL